MKKILGRLCYPPDLKVSPHHYPLKRLGSAYGGWTFVDSPGLRNSTIISCGLGEDASFDIEFADEFDARMILVDPTPRAIQHYHEICANFGRTATREYAPGGRQTIASYDLSGVSAKNFTLIERALWVRSGRLKFFCPQNQTHVSHTLLEDQGSHHINTEYIEVEALTIDQLLLMCQCQSIGMIKLDIEGAEIEVIIDMINKKIYPDQIMVEYDELAYLNRKNQQRIMSAHQLLLKSGYSLIHHDQPSNFLYVRNRP
jgi:FkbM family methyltransferase